jgi:hypothetical protein
MLLIFRICLLVSYSAQIAFVGYLYPQRDDNKEISCPVQLIICRVNVGFDLPIRIENEISSVPADYARL